MQVHKDKSISDWVSVPANVDALRTFQTNNKQNIFLPLSYFILECYIVALAIRGRFVLDSDCPSRDCLCRGRRISVPFDGVTGFIKSHRWPEYSAGDRAPFPDVTINYTAPCSVSYTLLAPFCTAYFSYPSFPSSLLLLAAIFLSSVFLSVYRSLSNPWPRNDTSSGRGFTRVQRYI